MLDLNNCTLGEAIEEIGRLRRDAADARAAGFAEAIEKAAKYVATNYSDYGFADLMAKAIRALAPAATTEEPK